MACNRETMKTIELAQVGGSLAEYAQDVGDEPLILTLHGEPRAAIIAYKDLSSTYSLQTEAEEEIIPQEGESLLSYLARVEAQYKAEGGIPLEQVKRELGMTSSLEHLPIAVYPKRSLNHANRPEGTPP